MSEIEETNESTPTEAAQAETGETAAAETADAAPAEGGATVIVYSTPTCPYCHMAKEFLDQQGIEYEDVDVSTDTARAQEMIDKSGQMGVPVLDIKGKIIVGFNQPEIESALGIKGDSVEGETKEEGGK